jgi:hypothetical protein
MSFFEGLKKCNWKSANKLIRRVYPELAKIIDEISPSDKFTLYVAKYPYGTMIVDKGIFLVPNVNGHIVPLNHHTIPESYKRDLNFDGTIPVGVVTKNSIESFMTLGGHITPFTLFHAGSVLALWRIFDKGKSYQEAPFWGISSGSRATCMLPKITDLNGYKLLKRKYNLPAIPPKRLSDHWHIFSHLANHKYFSEPWFSEIIYFSKEWFSHQTDKEWQNFYHLLLKKVWQESPFSRNKMMFDYFFSVIQKKRNLRPNPYLADTLSHLIAMASGEAPGFIPAKDNKAIPINGLQKIFIEDYKIKKYSPIIMHTHHFSLVEKIPVYYSFQIPTTMQFSPRSNKALTTMTEMREIKHITEVLLDEIKIGKLGIERTPLFNLAKKIKIIFYHNEKDDIQEIAPAKDIAILDKSISKMLAINEQFLFPESSPFFRGCISISVLDKNN